jgi:hypothetical protein
VPGRNIHHEIHQWPQLGEKDVLLFIDDVGANRHHRCRQQSYVASVVSTRSENLTGDLI